MNRYDDPWEGSCKVTEEDMHGYYDACELFEEQEDFKK